MPARASPRSGRASSWSGPTPTTTWGWPAFSRPLLQISRRAAAAGHHAPEQGDAEQHDGRDHQYPQHAFETLRQVFVLVRTGLSVGRIGMHDAILAIDVELQTPRRTAA